MAQKDPDFTIGLEEEYLLVDLETCDLAIAQGHCADCGQLTGWPRWRIYDHFLISENRWRAQRYVVNEGLIDFSMGKVVPFAALVEELIEMLREDAEALGCLTELHSVRRILQNGTSADRQRAIYAKACAGGASEHEALVQVVKSLVAKYSEDL